MWVYYCKSLIPGWFNVHGFVVLCDLYHTHTLTSVGILTLWTPNKERQTFPYEPACLSFSQPPTKQKNDRMTSKKKKSSLRSKYSHARIRCVIDDLGFVLFSLHMCVPNMLFTLTWHFNDIYVPTIQIRSVDFFFSRPSSHYCIKRQL